MKTIKSFSLVFIAAALFSSCKNIQNSIDSNKEHVVREIHHTTDSVYVKETIIRDTIVVERDTSSFSFMLEELKRIGQINHSSGRIHTQIIKDESGAISVNTTVDSLMFITESLTKEVFQLKTVLRGFEDNFRQVTSSEKTVNRKPFPFFRNFSWWLNLILIFVLLYLFRKPIAAWIRRR